MPSFFNAKENPTKSIIPIKIDKSKPISKLVIIPTRLISAETTYATKNSIPIILNSFFILFNSLFAIAKVATQGGQNKLKAIKEYALYGLENSELKSTDNISSVSTIDSFASSPDIMETEDSHEENPNG